MSDDPPTPEPIRRRRPRYAGKHPRRFEEKYKEHQPERYADDIAKVVASGKTPAGFHRPIMVGEILEVLRIQPGETVVDCTLGYGGHARELLTATQPGGRLIGLDQDPLELPKTETRLRSLGFPVESLLMRRMNFAGLAALLAHESPGGADAILADLGLSSMQIDNPARGFTFKVDAPLDMRMNPDRGLSATALLAKTKAAELAQWLAEYSDEPRAAALADPILRAKPQTTRALATIIRGALAQLPRRIAGDEIEATVRRVFQAIRIVVNDEFSALESWLRNLPQCLKAGGRVAVLSFHSGEDRRVKQAFKAGWHEGVYSAISDEVLRASPSEQHSNPRSAPAKLRWAVKA
jgi:16S rRNA (cytosine1402-N4)-methyltransferase